LAHNHYRDVCPQLSIDTQRQLIVRTSNHHLYVHKKQANKEKKVKLKESEGLGIGKVVVSDANAANRIVIDESDETFDIADVHKYQDIFAKLKECRLIIKGEFDDNVWVVKSGRNGEKKISFGLEVFGQVHQAMKSFAVRNMKSGSLPRSVGNKVSSLHQAIIKTGCFDPEKIQIFKQYMSSLGGSQRNKLRITTIQFLEFYHGPVYDDYIGYAQGMGLVPDKKRELPDYKSILIFDNCIKKTVIKAKEDGDNQILLAYYPLFLWWRITSVIPMRPCEFVELEFNCCYIDEDGKIWIRVIRKKAEKEDYTEDVSRIDTLEVTEDLYWFIEDYKSLVKEEYRSPYLLNYMSYNQTIIRLEKDRKAAISKKYDLDFLECSQFASIFRDFYTKVVIPQYPEITALKPGDSRHLAFCNMLLQGKNPLTIAGMGGHGDLDSQNSYFGHLKPYAESYVKYMVEGGTTEQTVPDLCLGRQKALRRSQLLSTYTQAELEKMTYIYRGYCEKSSDDSFDYAECPGLDCLFFCPKHIADTVNHPEIIQELQDQRGEIKAVRNEQFALLESLYQSMFKDIRTKQSLTSERSLKALSIQIKANLERQINVDAYLIDILFEEEKNE